MVVAACFGAVLLWSLRCNQGTDWGCPSDNSEQFDNLTKKRTTKFVKTGKEDGLKYEVYDLVLITMHTLCMHTMKVNHEGIEFVVQQDATNAWELYDLDAPDWELYEDAPTTFCWETLG